MPHLDLQLLFTAAGLALVLEGLPYFLFADHMPEFLRLLASRPASVLRGMGLAAMLGGLLLIYLCHH